MVSASTSEISSAQVLPRDGQIEFLLALLRYIGRRKNPLRILREEIYPQWHDSAEFVPNPYRSRKNEPYGLAPEYAAQRKRGLLVGWADRCKLFAREGNGEPPEWLLQWAMQELDRGGKLLFGTDRRSEPWWLRRLSTSIPPVPDAALTAGQAPPMLGAPEPVENMPIRLVIEVPPAATKAVAQKLFDSAWKHLSREPRNENVSPSAGVGRPVNPKYFEYLALGLCGVNRKAIAARFHVRENAVSVGARRAAKRAGLRFSYR